MAVKAFKALARYDAYHNNNYIIESKDEGEERLMGVLLSSCLLVSSLRQIDIDRDKWPEQECDLFCFYLSPPNTNPSTTWRTKNPTLQLRHILISDVNINLVFSSFMAMIAQTHVGL